MLRHLLLVSSLIATTTRSDGGERISLFDGNTLSNWDYDPEHWRVENQAMVGEIPKGQQLNHNTWIIWKGGELENFDLRLQVKLSGEPQANSGIQFRAQAMNPNHVSGYQADLDMGATWLGRIYDEHGRALLVERGQSVSIDRDGKRNVTTFSPPNLFAPIFRENQWNDYQIVAVGERVKVFINGTLFSELIDVEESAHDLSGKLAFQLHSGPETRVEFKNISLEVLTKDDNRLGRPKTSQEEVQSNPESNRGFVATDADSKPLNLGFEDGSLKGWTVTGDAFRGQPVKDDTISQRWSNQISNKQGDYFIGGYEVTLTDAGRGTLTSESFKALAPYASFLIAGGDTPETRVEIIAMEEDNATEEVIFSASGQKTEQMRRVVINLQPYMNRLIAVRVIDESSGGWGHLNFDDFRFHENKPLFADSTPNSPLNNPLLHHLVENPNADSIPGETLSKMSVPEGFQVNLIAAEPDLHQPMAFTFDAKGRLWVVEGHCYPTKRSEGQGIDKIIILEDTDHDGSFETHKVFIKGLNLVSGIQVGHGGVWVGAAPELLFIPDEDHDGRPDGEPIVLLDGFGYGDTHETLNSFMWGPDGWLYGNQGVFNQSHVGKPGDAKNERTYLAAGVWRYHPTKHQFEVFAHGGSNRWGLDFDNHGQLFMTHCRSAHGGGPTTHVIQGGHYWNQINGNYAPLISASPIAGLADRNFLLASARYGHGEGGAGKPGSRALYGGHSHVGTMIYLGDNWPDEYRNHLFTHNLHGHRINHQVNHRSGSGFNTVHAGYDVFHCNDPQYIGVDLQYGPDGAVYISDWYDPRHCHSPHTEQWQRGNGRMYRMSYEGYQPANVDYYSASDVELAQAQLHDNEWHARAARLVLAERAHRDVVDAKAVKLLRSIATTHTASEYRLRAIWCLHSINQINGQLASQMAEDPSEYVRGWMIQLLAENEHFSDRESIFNDLLKKEDSMLVKLYFTSAAGRLQNSTGWKIIETLVSQKSNAEDRTLSMLLWQSLATFIEHDLDRAMALLDRTQVPSIEQYIYWFAPQVSDRGRSLITRQLAKSDGDARLQIIKLFAAGIQNQRNLKAPEGWHLLADELYQNEETRGPAEQLGARFGDQILYGRMRQVLNDEQSSIQEKQHALGILTGDSDPSNLPTLLKLIDTPELQIDVVNQLKHYDSEQAAEALISRLEQLPPSSVNSALETLCSRKNFAIALLVAIERGQIPKARLTSFYARQMSNLGSSEVDQRLAEQWGKLGQSSAESKASIEDLVNQYKKAPLWAFNRNQGEATYKKLCSNCHSQTDQSQRIGPKLEGSGTKGIEYVVENIIDPNAVIGEDFLARQILTVDGTVVTGVVLKESETALTVRTATSTQIIAKDDVDQIVISKNSFMPEGILKPLSDRERIELLMYVMSM